MLRTLGRYLWSDFKKKMISRKGTWAAIAVGVVGAGVSAYSSSQSKKGGGGQMGYDVITPKSIGEQSKTGREGADYWSNAVQGLATGDPYRGYGPYEELMKRKLQRGQTEAFYGTPGSRSSGAYGAGIESGALLGLGAGRTQAGLRPLQNQWVTGSQNIEEFLAQQRQQAMQQREGTLLNYGLGLSQPYGGQQIAPYSNPGLPAQTDPWAGLAGNLIGSGALEGGFNKLGGFLSNTFTPSATNRANQVNPSTSAGGWSTPPPGQNYRPGG